MIDSRLNYTNFTTSILAYSFEDDEWGYRDAVDRITCAYENAPVRRIHIDPEDTNNDEIGHFGFFTTKTAALWQDLLERLKKY